MKITICGSIVFTYEIEKIAKELGAGGHQVEIPLTSKQILKNRLTIEEFKKDEEKETRKIKDDVIRKYYQKIKKSDAILVTNFEKNKVKNYIGGNTFLEIGFAYVLNKKIYLLNPIPEMIYTDELKAMQPKVINGDLSKIT